MISKIFTSSVKNLSMKLYLDNGTCQELVYVVKKKEFVVIVPYLFRAFLVASFLKDGRSFLDFYA